MAWQTEYTVTAVNPLNDLPPSWFAFPGAGCAPKHQAAGDAMQAMHDQRLGRGPTVGSEVMTS